MGNVRANDVVLASDARLKTDVRPMCEARRKLEKLRGVEFAWKEAGGGSGGPASRRSAGIIAQEVESVAPELVQPEREGGHKGVSVSGLLGILVEAFKELEAENRTLTRRIEALERAAARDARSLSGG